MKVRYFLFVLLASIAIVTANDVDVVRTEFTKQGDSWHVSTTLKYNDAGWDHHDDA
jgi:hypothetical protein